MAAAAAAAAAAAVVFEECCWHVLVSPLPVHISPFVLFVSRVVAIKFKTVSSRTIIVLSWFCRKHPVHLRERYVQLLREVGFDASSVLAAAEQVGR